MRFIKYSLIALVLNFLNIALFDRLGFNPTAAAIEALIAGFVIGGILARMFLQEVDRG